MKLRELANELGTYIEIREEGTGGFFVRIKGLFTRGTGSVAATAGTGETLEEAKASYIAKISGKSGIFCGPYLNLKSIDVSIPEELSL